MSFKHSWAALFLRRKKSVVCFLRRNWNDIISWEKRPDFGRDSFGISILNIQTCINPCKLLQTLFCFCFCMWLQNVVLLLILNRMLIMAVWTRSVSVTSDMSLRTAGVTLVFLCRKATLMVCRLNLTNQSLHKMNKCHADTLISLWDLSLHFFVFLQGLLNSILLSKLL